MQSLPVIDLGKPAVLTQNVEDACHRIGFMYVTGHAIEDAVIAAARKAVIDFFALSEEEKRESLVTCDNYRGYIPRGFFSPAGNTTPADNYEGYKLHFDVAEDDPVIADCDLYGPNKWPDVPKFKMSLQHYWQECDRVAKILLWSLAEIMGITPQKFLRHFECPLTNMTLLHYPPQANADDGFGIHPHKDTDALTILAPDPVGGLLVKRRDNDDWLSAEPLGNALIVNIGDMLELWSGGFFKSTPHKVVNLSGAERYSFPYFAVPRYDTVIKPLMEPQPGFERDRIHAGDVSREVWRNNWPNAVPSDPRIDLGTLQD